MDELDIIGDSYNKIVHDFSVAISDTKSTLRQLIEKNHILDKPFV